MIYYSRADEDGYTDENNNRIIRQIESDEDHAQNNLSFGSGLKDKLKRVILYDLEHGNQVKNKKN